jgi:hypothetical protein
MPNAEYFLLLAAYFTVCWERRRPDGEGGILGKKRLAICGGEKLQFQRQHGAIQLLCRRDA